jgi:hypothetical protein
MRRLSSRRSATVIPPASLRSLLRDDNVLQS